MIFNFLINFLVMIVGSIFNQFPTVTTLPSIGGFDIDAALVSGMGDFNAIANTFWYLKDIFAGFLILTGYYGIRLLAKLFLGTRAPGLH